MRITQVTISHPYPRLASAPEQGPVPVPPVQNPPPVPVPPGQGAQVASLSFTAQTEVLYTHNRGRQVLVQVRDADGLIGAEVTYPDLNTVRVRFNQPVTGTLILI